MSQWNKNKPENPFQTMISQTKIMKQILNNHKSSTLRKKWPLVTCCHFFLKVENLRWSLKIGQFPTKKIVSMNQHMNTNAPALKFFWYDQPYSNESQMCNFKEEMTTLRKKWRKKSGC